MKVKNAIILAAGASSRFAPLSHERHKALTEVRGEVLIERQIGQLLEAGIEAIYIVTGYQSEQFAYLQKKYGAHLIHNVEYLSRNNHSSIWAARDVLGDSYVCSADNYFTKNPFETSAEGAYYAAVYADGHTDEWCMTKDADGYIDQVTIGGENAWYMLGHTFWDAAFAKQFLEILLRVYDLPETKDKLWEHLFMEHLDVLKMRIKKYPRDVIFEFDSLDELRCFDETYRTDARSKYLSCAAEMLSVKEQELANIRCLRGDTTVATGFSFDCGTKRYQYEYESGQLTEFTG